MEKIYRQGNAYFDTYYIHAKCGYIGILEHHCRGVKILILLHGLEIRTLAKVGKIR